jgi:hypothetical protein
MQARLMSLLLADTRMMELFSAILKLAWATGFFLFYKQAPDESAFGKIDDYIAYPAILFVLVPVAVFHAYSTIAGCQTGRRVCITFGILWWSWVTALMFQMPPNYAAGITYAVVVLFDIWCFLALGRQRRTTI